MSDERYFLCFFLSSSVM